MRRTLAPRGFRTLRVRAQERWTSPVLNVVNFADNGREIKETVANKYPYLNGKTAWVVKNEQYYFRAGLCFSFVSTEQFCARVLPAGCIFDVAASALFPAGDSADFSSRVSQQHSDSNSMLQTCESYEINMQVE